MPFIPGGGDNEIEVVIEYESPGAVLNLSPYVTSLAIDTPSERVDTRTFAYPRRSDVGGGMDACTLTILWSVEVWSMVKAVEGREGECTIDVNGEEYVFTTRIHKAPFSTFTIGGRAEATLELAVLSDIEPEED